MKAKKAGKRVQKPLPQDRFDPKAFARKRACVLGMGRSGLAAARLLARKGFSVFVSEARPRKDLKDAARKLPPRARWEGGGHSDRVLECGFAVKSPGMLPSAPVLAKLRAAGIPVFSELEVALAFCPPAEIVAITGTNGKTTTTALAAACFKAGRRRVHVAGNVGDAVSGEVAKVRKGDTLVLEVSSYQLEDSRHFKPDAAVILNVTSDHLDHHGSMEAYIAAKARVFREQDRSRHCVFNASEPLSGSLARSCRARKLFFGHAPSTLCAAWLEGGKISVRMPGEKKPVRLTPPPIPGAHNLDNAMAAALLAFARGVPTAAVQKAFRAFRGVEHRIEDCGVMAGIRCVNDSKATNVDSTLAALRSLPSPDKRILLILGGLAKPGGFKPLRGPVEANVKAVLTIGSAAPKIEEDLAGAAHAFPCETLEAAVRVARQIGQKGDTLLLSPACASFDQFRDFEDRGQRFKELVKKAGRGA
ncbi:MAG TPA: UDP-N-acetylmuramoyl-L-alanine--D-glutamate ligase [Elusimicrobiota bacterium]|jgi:UDP-N-acetylmuramoylalanine--D-glutamate ligase|nr:UDP-N-acetylmuramoyl-L-alanine--D-glutamate ligase [Elusimicrobiota bacterium]